MAFLYSAIGDNTKENREWLEKIGAKLPNSMTLDGDFLYVYTAFNGEYCYYSVRHKQAPIPVVDCIGNPQLFKAVSAMRDDSDYMQWYYSDDHEEEYWVLSDQHVIKNKDCVIDNIVVWHKATLSELQEHFQRV